MNFEKLDFFTIADQKSWLSIEQVSNSKHLICGKFTEKDLNLGSILLFLRF